MQNAEYRYPLVRILFIRIIQMLCCIPFIRAGILQQNHFAFCILNFAFI